MKKCWGSEFKSRWVLDSGHTNAWIKEEETTICKSHIAPVSLTDNCIMIFFLNYFILN